MESVCPRSTRYVWLPLVLTVVLLAPASIASAQGFGVGARMSWVKSDTEADLDAVRFVGGQIRLMSSHWGFELALDHHSEEFEALNQKLTETPIQASVLMRLGRGSSFAPFLLGGAGWYKRKVEAIEGSHDLDIDETEFGWHAGGGLEILAGRHFGIHGDYRYTFLDFGKDDNEDSGFIKGLLPGHKGSMWTAGATVYF